MSHFDKQVVNGNVETMLLAVLTEGPSYGYRIVQELNTRARGLLGLGEGTVYPILHRMEEKELISASWQTARSGRDRKYYRLTTKGRKALAENRGQWERMVKIMEHVLEPAKRPATS